MNLFVIDATTRQVPAEVEVVARVAGSVVRRRRVADGGDPVGVAFTEDDALVSVIAGNYIVGPDTDPSTVPLLSIDDD